MDVLRVGVMIRVLEPEGPGHEPERQPAEPIDGLIEPAAAERGPVGALVERREQVDDDDAVREDGTCDPVGAEREPDQRARRRHQCEMPRQEQEPGPVAPHHQRTNLFSAQQVHDVLGGADCRGRRAGTGVRPHRFRSGQAADMQVRHINTNRIHYTSTRPRCPIAGVCGRDSRNGAQRGPALLGRPSTAACGRRPDA